MFVQLCACVGDLSCHRFTLFNTSSTLTMLYTRTYMYYTTIFFDRQDMMSRIQEYNLYKEVPREKLNSKEVHKSSIV